MQNNQPQSTKRLQISIYLQFKHFRYDEINV